MTVTSDLSIVLGAVLGITAACIAPSATTKKRNNNSKKDGSRQYPSIIVHDPDNSIVHTETPCTISEIKFGETTMLDVLNIIKNEVSILLDSTVHRIKLFVSDTTSSNNVSKDKSDDSQLAEVGKYTTATDIMIEPETPIADESTIYNELPFGEIKAPTIKKKQPVKKTRDLYNRVKNKDELDTPTGESTLLHPNKSNRSGFHLSFHQTKSPIRRIFRRMINLLRFRNNESQNSSKTSRKKSPPVDLLDSDYSEITKLI